MRRLRGTLGAVVVLRFRQRACGTRSPYTSPRGDDSSGPRVGSVPDGVAGLAVRVNRNVAQQHLKSCDDIAGAKPPRSASRPAIIDALGEWRASRPSEALGTASCARSPRSSRPAARWSSGGDRDGGDAGTIAGDGGPALRAPLQGLSAGVLARPWRLAAGRPALRRALDAQLGHRRLHRSRRPAGARRRRGRRRGRPQSAARRARRPGQPLFAEQPAVSQRALYRRRARAGVSRSRRARPARRDRAAARQPTWSTMPASSPLKTAALRAAHRRFRRRSRGPAASAPTSTPSSASAAPARLPIRGLRDAAGAIPARRGGSGRRSIARRAASCLDELAATAPERDGLPRLRAVAGRPPARAIAATSPARLGLPIGLYLDIAVGVMSRRRRRLERAGRADARPDDRRAARRLQSGRTELGTCLVSSGGAGVLGLRPVARNPARVDALCRRGAARPCARPQPHVRRAGRLRRQPAAPMCAFRSRR